jgi:hypothetical protein
VKSTPSQELMMTMKITRRKKDGEEENGGGIKGMDG